MWKNAFKKSETPEKGKVPFDNAWPLKKVHDLAVCAALADRHFLQASELHDDSQWKRVDWQDPSGGDMQIFNRPPMGSYHCVKGTFTVDCKPAAIAELMSNNDFAVRKSFSTDVVAMKELARATDSIAIVHIEYAAPAPVSSRDFCFLVGRREANGVHDVCGCSVDFDACPERRKPVRSAGLWGWRAATVNGRTVVSYVNCFDPRGWAPSFVPTLMKTTVSKALIGVRSATANKRSKL
jgi:hypothetical protein